MTKIYVISGLGADRTVFSRIDWGELDVIHLDWIDPMEEESLKNYALRLVENIDLKDAYLLGLSLGGMMALEISAHKSVKGVLLLSSIRNKGELPWHLKLGGNLRMYQWFPIHWVAKNNRLTRWFFGITEEENKQVFGKIMEKLDRRFLYWSLGAVMKWEASEPKNPIYRIHGTTDFVLPERKQGDYQEIVQKGGHLMVLENHEKVQSAIHTGILKLESKG